jgi:hypothetical protein
MSPPAPADPVVVVEPVVVVSLVVTPVALDVIVPARIVPPTVVEAPGATDESGEGTMVRGSALPQSTRHQQAVSHEPTPRRWVLFMMIKRWVRPRKGINAPMRAG